MPLPNQLNGLVSAANEFIENSNWKHYMDFAKTLRSHPSETFDESTISSVLDSLQGDEELKDIIAARLYIHVKRYADMSMHIRNLQHSDSLRAYAYFVIGFAFAAGASRDDINQELADTLELPQSKDGRTLEAFCYAKALVVDEKNSTAWYNLGFQFSYGEIARNDINQELADTLELPQTNHRRTLAAFCFAKSLEIDAKKSDAWGEFKGAVAWGPFRNIVVSCTITYVTRLSERINPEQLFALLSSKDKFPGRALAQAVYYMRQCSLLSQKLTSISSHAITPEDKEQFILSFIECTSNAYLSAKQSPIFGPSLFHQLSMLFGSAHDNIEIRDCLVKRLLSNDENTSLTHSKRLVTYNTGLSGYSFYLNALSTPQSSAIDVSQEGRALHLSLIHLDALQKISEQEKTISNQAQSLEENKKASELGDDKRKTKGFAAPTLLPGTKRKQSDFFLGDGKSSKPEEQKKPKNWSSPSNSL